MSDVKLYNGDCLEVMDKLIAEGIKVDLTVTSPPYDNLRSYNGNNESWNESVWKSVIEKLYKITSDGGVVVWVVGDKTEKGSETGTSFKQALYSKEVGFNLHDTMIYGKDNYVPLTHNRYEQQFEFMFVFSKGKPKTFNPIKTKCEQHGRIKSNNGKNGDGESKNEKSSHYNRIKDKEWITSDYKIKPNIWFYKCGKWLSSKDELAFKHPAIFPEQLANDHILSWSNENDIIFDPMMGSGTTGKMAVLNNRNFIGIELDETYFKIAQERIEKAEAEVKLSAK